MRNGLVVVKTNTFEREGHIDEKWSYCRQNQYICKERTYLMRNDLIVVKTNTFERKRQI